MYHKKAYADEVSLKAFVEKQNASQSDRDRAEQKRWQNYMKREDNQLKKQIEQGLEEYNSSKSLYHNVKENVLPSDSVRPATKKEEEKAKMARPSKKKTQLKDRIKKLNDELSETTDKMLKLDDALLEPKDDISKKQLELMSFQRDGMSTTRRALQLRIEDLEEQAEKA